MATRHQLGLSALGKERFNPKINPEYTHMAPAFKTAPVITKAKGSINPDPKTITPANICSHKNP